MGWGAAGEGSFFLLVDAGEMSRAFDVEVGHDAVEPSRDVPGVAAEEGHDGGNEDHADDAGVDENSGRHADCEHFDSGVRVEHEAGEYDDHDRGGRGDDASRAADAD